MSTGWTAPFLPFMKQVTRWFTYLAHRLLEREMRRTLASCAGTLSWVEAMAGPPCLGSFELISLQGRSYRPSSGRGSSHLSAGFPFPGVAWGNDFSYYFRNPDATAALHKERQPGGKPEPRYRAISAQM